MTRTDPFDELAAMFMTSDDEPRRGSAPGDGPDEDRPSARTTIEVLLVGHLPVRAALWLTPFADAVARDAGTTALVRLDGDEPLVQVLRGESAGPITSARNLRETILDIGGHVEAWILRPSLQTGVPALIDMARGISGPDVGADIRFTILSSADQAAIVNAYRLVKDLVETAARRGGPVPEIGLAVIGADPDTATSVAERLSRTTLECLGLSVPLTHCLARIDSQVRGSALRTFPGRARPDLDEVVGWITESGRRRAPGVEPVAREAEAPVIETRRAPMPSLDVPAPAPASPSWLSDPIPGLDAAGAIPLASGAEPAAAAGPPARPSAGPARATVDVEAKAPEHVREPDRQGLPTPLAEHVEGLTPLAPRCPGHERVELAVDTRGRLQILCREDALRSLHAVSAWVRAHRELIAMACPGHALEPTGRAVLHVFTDAPLKVADLHASAIRLHVLAPVRAGDSVAWYCAPLNGAPE